MKKVFLLIVFLPFLLAASCPGMSSDPTVSKIQTATVTCASMAATINILTDAKGAGQLSPTAIAEVDFVIAAVKPICGTVATSGNFIDLDALSDALRQLQKISGGVS